MIGRHLPSPSPSGEGIEGWGRCARPVQLMRCRTHNPHNPHPNPSPEGEEL
jgi:hypothetical protein